MYDYDFSKRDITVAAQTSPTAEARDLAQLLLEHLRKEPQYDGWTTDLLRIVDDSNSRVAKFRADLIGVLEHLESDPSAIQDERVYTKLKDSAFVFQGRVEALQTTIEDWADKLKSDVEKATKAYKSVNVLLGFREKLKEWNQPLTKKKGKSKLGTSIQFEVEEITRRGITWDVYVTEVGGKKYRIAPPTPGEKGWMLDVGGVTWEALSGQVYSSPKDAAKALEARLQVTREV